MTPNDLLKMLQDSAASSDLYTHLRECLIASFDLKPYQENAAKYSNAELSKDVRAEIGALSCIVTALSTLTQEVTKVGTDEEAAHISQEYQEPIVNKILYGELTPAMLREKLPHLAPPKSELSSKPFLFHEGSFSKDMQLEVSFVEIVSEINSLTELNQMCLFKKIKDAVQQGHQQITAHSYSKSSFDALVLAWSLYCNFDAIFSEDDINVIAKNIVAELNSLREQRPGLVQEPLQLMSAIELAAKFKAFSLDTIFDEKLAQQLAAVEAEKELAVTKSLRDFGYLQQPRARPTFFRQVQEKPNVLKDTRPRQRQCCTIS